jgi:ribosomal protein S27E
MPKKAGVKTAKDVEKAKLPKASKAASLRSCPACGSDNVIYRKEEDELYCQDCSEVFAELSPDDESDFERASDVL